MAAWYTEWISENVMESFKVVKTLYSGYTKYQRVEILEAEEYGKCLMLDRKMQSSLLDEHIYHELLVHPALCLHGKPRRVAVIGGGEGAALREVLKWKTVEEAFQVDIDSEVVGLCRKYLPELSRGAFDDPRVKLFYGDGRRWVDEKLEGAVDVFIIDVTDPLEGGPSYLLYTLEFYKILSSKLNSGGVVATHATSPCHTPYVFHSIRKTMGEVFRNVSELATYIMSFSSMWGFLYGSNSYSLYSLNGDDIDRRLREAGVSNLRFYSGTTHQALLSLSPYYISLKRVEPRIIEDSTPLYTP